LSETKPKHHSNPQILAFSGGAKAPRTYSAFLNTNSL